MTPALADPTAVSCSGFTSSFRAEIKTVPAQAGQHFLRMTYRVAGGAEAGLDKLAPVVDGVIGEQFKRLKTLIETGQAS